jgi:hypothetical protein
MLYGVWVSLTFVLPLGEYEAWVRGSRTNALTLSSFKIVKNSMQKTKRFLRCGI